MEDILKKNKRKIYFYTIYKALAYDFYFFYAIDSLFYTEIINMSFSTISLVATVYAFFVMLLQIPMVRVVRKIGTVNSSRIGTLCYLMAGILTFFNIYTIFIAQLVFAIGVGLKNPSEAKLLKDNLKMYGLSENYAKYTGISKFIYSIITALATFVAGMLFEIAYYIPLILCYSFLIIASIMSIFIKNEKEIYKKQNNLPQHNTEIEKHEVFKLFKYRTTWLLVFLSIFFSAAIACSMDINKQAYQELGIASATLITIIVGIAYVFRAFSSLLFNFVYKKIKFNAIYIIIALIGSGILMLSLGSIFATGTTALIIMGIGTTLLYTSRDPYNTLKDDFVMNSKGLTKRQTLLSITNSASYLGRFALSFMISMLLLSQTVASTYLIIFSSMTPFLILFAILVSRKRKINKY